MTQKWAQPVGQYVHHEMNDPNFCRIQTKDMKAKHSLIYWKIKRYFSKAKPEARQLS